MRRATPLDYLSLARPDHWIKNVFIVPGVVFALALGARFTEAAAWALPVGFLSACLAASANYTINEWLDRRFDAFHPTKNARASVVADLKPALVYAQWAVLAVAALALAWTIRFEFLVITLWLLLMGLVYNVPPLRTKDRAYVDVLSESINNPIRFLLGWFLLDPPVYAPSSILISYWFGGAYLMAAKRFAEYRSINDRDVAVRYRKSFAHYSEESLLVSAVIYAILSSTFLGVFLMKYKVEFILIVPLIAILFGWYLHIGLRKDSVAQAPENLYKETSLWIFVLLAGCVATALFFVRIPGLEALLYIRHR